MPDAAISGWPWKQDANTSGWFHIPILTPKVLAGDTMISFLYFALSAKVNDNAKVDRIPMRRGKDILFSEHVSFLYTTINQLFDNPSVSMSIGASLFVYTSSSFRGSSLTL